MTHEQTKMQPAASMDHATHAVIYCRVSTTKQKTQGHGLDSQEMRCRDYAAGRGYHVDAVFLDDASGGGDFMNRPRMVALLEHLDSKPDQDFVVIFDDLKRFARDTIFHLKLRHELSIHNARPECLNFNFGDTPEEVFVETVIAAQGELEREQNRRQTIQKMQARVKAGYYLFGPPIGYRYEKVEGHGRLLVGDENAPVVKEALEGFACGRFQSPTEVSRFLKQKKPSRNGRIYSTQLPSTINMLQRSLYAGYINVPEWGMYLVPGKHEPLIDLATHQKILDRLDGRSPAPARADLHEDFPLRNFVTCHCCNEPMTAAWAKGRTKNYAYYWCKTKGCAQHRKSIKRESIHDAFEMLVRSLQPLPSLFNVVRAMFKELWDMRLSGAQDERKRVKQDVVALDSKISKLMDRLIDADSDQLVTAYEEKIKKLEVEKAMLSERARTGFEPVKTFEESFKAACAFLANPWKLWVSDKFEHKRMVLRLAFPGTLAYCPENGFRTAKTTLPFKVLGVFAAEILIWCR